MLNSMSQLCLSHFLCAFDPKSKKRKTEDVAREITLLHFSPERVEEFIEERLAQLQQSLVEEFNERHATGKPLRFQIVDSAGVGEIVEGRRSIKTSKEIRFQDSLHSVTPGQFEKLAAILLREIGCGEVFFTPTSHDQGVDAFGYQDLVGPTPHGITHKLTWIAQAKHYKSTSVSTVDLRELVGTLELLVAKVFSTVDEKYKELTLRPYSPAALALVTTEEIPSTVRRLAERSGLFVFASSDLYHIFAPRLSRNSARAIQAYVQREAVSIRTLS